MKTLAFAAAALVLAPAAFAKEKKAPPAQSHHCEVDGKEVTATKKACTKQKGTWAKGAPAAAAPAAPAK